MKYLRSMTFCCKDKGIKESEFVAKTLFLYLKRERDPDFAVLILKIYYKKGKGSRYCGSNPIFLLMKRKGLIKRKGIQIFQLLSYIVINERGERDPDIAALILYFYYIKGKGSRYCSSNPFFQKLRSRNCNQGNINISLFLNNIFLHLIRIKTG